MERVEIYMRNPDCGLCGSEMNPGREHHWRGLEICIKCHDELGGGGRNKSKHPGERVKRELHRPDCGGKNNSDRCWSGKDKDRKTFTGGRHTAR